MTRARDLADIADKDISGTLVIDDLTASGDVTIAGDLSVTGSTTGVSSGNLSAVLTTGNTTGGNNIVFGDSSGASDDRLVFGAGSDLQIYHSGAASFISDQGTGRLKVLATDLSLNNAGDTASYIVCTDGGDVQLYHNGASKLATTSTGVDVTGTVTADGLTVDSSSSVVATIGSSGSSAARLYFDNTGMTTAGDTQLLSQNNDLAFNTNGSEAMRITSSGNVELNGLSNGTLNFVGGNTSNGSKIQAFNNAGTGDGYLAIEGYTKEYMRIDSSGNLLVGTTSTDPAGTSNNVVGTAIGAGGYLSMTRDGNTAAFFNRKTSDGDIAHFRKDGTVVGSIGSRGGADLYVGSGDTNFKFAAGSDAIVPATTAGADRDNAIDLGISTVRYKDLYLGGELNITGSGNTDVYINTGNNSGDNSRIFFGDSADIDVGFLAYDHGTNAMVFGVNAAERMRINSSGIFLVGTNSSTLGGSVVNKVGVVSDHTTGQQTMTVYNSSTSCTANGIFLVGTARTNNSAYDIINGWSNGVSDKEFQVRGDGQVFCDGSFTGGGADYAEYFEWSDGNPDNEDRRGYSVVLEGDKIRKATSSDAASSIIGVISGNPSVVGDGDMQSWKNKYLRDDFGGYARDENGNRVLNPDYEENQEYIPRENRTEWDTVGLMGKLRIRKGQPTSSNWIKMRDVSDTVEEWLVR